MFAGCVSSECSEKDIGYDPCGYAHIVIFIIIIIIVIVIIIVISTISTIDIVIVSATHQSSKKPDGRCKPPFLPPKVLTTFRTSRCYHQ